MFIEATMFKRILALAAVLLAAPIPTNEAGAEALPGPLPPPGTDDATRVNSRASLVPPPVEAAAAPPVQPAPPAPPPPGPAVAAAADRARRGAKSRRRPTAPSGDVLARIRACESGSDYGARSSSGRYGGAYQMDRRTFASVGGSGDPAAATQAEQDYRARLLYQQRGTQAWPSCG